MKSLYWKLRNVERSFRIFHNHCTWHMRVRFSQYVNCRQNLRLCFVYLHAASSEFSAPLPHCVDTLLLLHQFATVTPSRCRPVFVLSSLSHAFDSTSCYHLSLALLLRFRADASLLSSSVALLPASWLWASASPPCYRPILPLPSQPCASIPPFHPANIFMLQHRPRDVATRIFYRLFTMFCNSFIW